LQELQNRDMNVLETRLRESQKLEAMGALAGGVAHDFNNILAVIMGNTDVALLSLNAPEVATRCLREISKASERGRELVRQILSFGRPRATERRLISIIPVVEESIQLLRATLPARVKLTMECTDSLSKVLVDATQIAQIVINLATNAFQAMAGQPGSIQIKIDSLPLDAELLELLPQIAPSSNEFDQVLRMVVTDDGPGMTALTASRLFEPYFTTKSVGEGTGLGLAVVSGIVRTHQGAIMVDSKPGSGATFTIYFPAIADLGQSHECTTAKSETVATPLGNGTKRRVLFVDDDPAVLQSITCLLEHQGFHVAGFSDQLAAMDAIRTNASQFDLIIADYNMPSLSGLEFARFVRGMRADLPIVIITGLIDDTLRTEAARIGIQELIAKPFSLTSFCSTLRRVAAQATTANC
jgi:nitrogen-specific signal transduction histidine kinase/ActR/RegA family two-component response regulator